VKDTEGRVGRLVSVSGNLGAVSSLEFPDPMGIRLYRRLEPVPMADLTVVPDSVRVALTGDVIWEAPQQITIQCV
jgi:hypothetical protein